MTEPASKNIGVNLIFELHNFKLQKKYAGICTWKSSHLHKDTKTFRPNCRRRRLSDSVLGCASIGGIIQILSVEILPQPSYTVNSGLWDWFCSNPSNSNSRDASLEKKTLLPNKTKDLEDFAWLKKKKKNIGIVHLCWLF